MKQLSGSTACKGGRVLWEGQALPHAGGDSSVTRHSLKCTWTPLHSYVDSKRKLGTRGCSAGRVSVPVHGGTVSPESRGPGGSPHFPPPTPTPLWSSCPLPQRWIQDPLWNCPGHHPPMFTQGPSTASHSRHTQGSLVSAERTASGPGGELGQCLEMGLLPQPSLHPWSTGSSWDPDGGQVGRPVTRQQGCGLPGPAPDRGRTDAGREGGTSSNKARRQSWRWRRRRTSEGEEKENRVRKSQATPRLRLNMDHLKATNVTGQ